MGILDSSQFFVTKHILVTVFGQFRYSLLSLVLSLLLLSVVVVATHFSLVSQVLFATELTIMQKTLFLVSLFDLLGTNYSAVSALLTILVIVLVSVNLTLLVYYIRRRQMSVSAKRGHAAGLIGVFAGVFGVGCAACGSVILTAVLTAVGAGSFVVLLPLHGVEFGFLGVALLLFSLHHLCQEVSKPLVCE